MKTSDLSKITKDFDKISVSAPDTADTELSKITKKKPEMVDLTTSSPTKGSMAVKGQNVPLMDLVTSKDTVLDVTTEDPKTIDLTDSKDKILAKDPDLEVVKSIVSSPVPKNQKTGISGKPWCAIHHHR